MKNSLFRQVLAESCEDDMSIERGNKILDTGNPDKGNRILDKGNPNIPLNEEEEHVYTVTFWVRQHDEKVDHHWDVKATSPENAIEKLETGQAKGPYGQELPRLARSFSAELKK